MTLRYNISATSGILGGTPTITLQARYQAIGRGARVLITLKRVDLDRDSTETITTLDSDNFRAAAGFHTMQDTICRTFAFVEPAGRGMNAYFLEVQLMKKIRPSNVAFAAVMIRSEDRLC